MVWVRETARLSCGQDNPCGSSTEDLGRKSLEAYSWRLQTDEDARIQTAELARLAEAEEARRVAAARLLAEAEARTQS